MTQFFPGVKPYVPPRETSAALELSLSKRSEEPERNPRNERDHDQTDEKRAEVNPNPP
jgi:hypothetical protein